MPKNYYVTHASQLLYCIDNFKEDYYSAGKKNSLRTHTLREDFKQFLLRLDIMYM
jgi:hypothetical protein